MQRLFMQESLAVLIAATRRCIKQRAWEMLRPHGLTPQQSGVVLILHTEGPLGLKLLASRIWCDTPTACRIVGKLVDRGLVLSTADAADKRRYNLSLTPAGKKLGRQVLGTANELAHTMQRGLSQQEVVKLREMLRTIMANMAAAAPSGGNKGRRSA